MLCSCLHIYMRKTKPHCRACMLWSSPCPLVQTQLCSTCVLAPPDSLNTIHIAQSSFSVLWLCQLPRRLGMLDSYTFSWNLPIFQSFFRIQSHTNTSRKVHMTPFCLTACPTVYYHICVYLLHCLSSTYIVSTVWPDQSNTQLSLQGPLQSLRHSKAEKLFIEINIQ